LCPELLRQNTARSHAAPSRTDRHHRHTPAVGRTILRYRGISIVDQALQARVRTRCEIGDRHHKIGHVIHLLVYFASGNLFASNFEHFVLDHVGQMQLFKNQVQGAFQRDFLSQRKTNRRVAEYAFLAQTASIEMDVHARELR
jgi:hypothetical protein